MDYSKISTADLQELQKATQSGDYSKVSTPGLQEYHNQMQHESQAQVQAQNPQKIPDSADAAAQGNKPNAQPISLMNNKNFPSSYGGSGQMTARAAQDNPSANEGFAKVGTGLALGGAGGAMAEGAGMAGRAAINAGASGLQKYFGNMMDGSKDPTQGVLGSAALGGAASAGLDSVSGGASKISDWLMQKAVGMKKYMPGVGNNLVDQGVWGTKSGMAEQVPDLLAKEEGKLQDTVQGLTGTVNSKEIADAISNKAQQFTLPSTGQASPFSELELQKVRDLADKTSKMGDLSASDLLALKRQGDYQAFTASGNPASSTDADLARTGANAARTALKEMSPDAANALLNERSLIMAKKGLDKPDSLGSGTLSSLFFGKAPGTSIGGSVAAQALQKGVSTPAGALADPKVLQGLFGLGQTGQNSSN
jgi:hypothetical protein